MDKQIAQYPNIRTLLGNIKEQTADTSKSMDESQVHYSDWKTPGSTGYILYDLFTLHSGEGRMRGKTDRWLSRTRAKAML